MIKDKYFTNRCDRDFMNTVLSRGGRVSRAIDNSLDLINLDVRYFSEFQNLALIVIVGVVWFFSISMFF